MRAEFRLFESSPYENLIFSNFLQTKRFEARKQKKSNQFIKSCPGASGSACCLCNQIDHKTYGMSPLQAL